MVLQVFILIEVSIRTNGLLLNVNYRDTHGDVHGPFPPAKMTELFNNGFLKRGFTLRRACDDTFLELIELSKMWGQLPFLIGTVENEKLELMKQQFHNRMNQVQNQRLNAVKQQAVLAKLSVMNGWSNLSPFQQQQVCTIHLQNQYE